MDFPFAGRTDELAQLGDVWDMAVADDQRRTVLVGGEPGIGKTRLVAELARRVQADDGALVLYGRCEEGLAVPYQPFVEALGPLIREGSDETLDAVDRFAQRRAHPAVPGTGVTAAAASRRPSRANPTSSATACSKP